MGKIKVLFIVSEFYQSGTSRLTYEINRSINKDEFETSFLCLTPLNNSEVWSDYYNIKHEELGSYIFFLNEINNIPKPNLKQRIIRKLLRQGVSDVNEPVNEFLNKFDVISILGEYNYPYVKRFLSTVLKSRVFIHCVNSIYQNPENYLNFEKEEEFNFVTGFLSEDLPLELAEFKKYNHTFLPLSFELPFSKPIWKKRVKKVSKIGIFTRLTKGKPIDPFIYSFQILLDSIPDLELHIFGSGDPQIEGMMRYVNQLGLDDKVIFRGHQSNMLETAINEDLDLVWLHGYHSVPGGWAGYDFCALGIPQIFWDFGGVKKPELENIFPMTNNVVKFTELSEKMLLDIDYSLAVRDLQFKYTEEYQNIYKYISNLEKAYKKCIKE